MRSGGHCLVDQLLLHGADMAFCVPGESYLEVLDGLHDQAHRIRLVNARHEAGAAHMAEAYGKLTGRPGICLVTRGPGACHAAVGVHVAFQDSTPMILLVGQVGRGFMDREAFQEIDYRQMFAPVAKWAAQIDSARRIPEYLSRAFHLATSGRPGPVVLALPEDVLAEPVDVADGRACPPAQSAVGPAQIAALRAELAAAARPLLLLGGPGWSDAACAEIKAFAEAYDLPAACSFRRQDVFPNESRCFAGDIGTSGPPALVRRVREADVLLVVGARLGEMTTQGYALLDAPVPRQRLLHVMPSADELGRVYAPDLAIQATPTAFAAAVADLRPEAPPRWAAWRRAARQDFLDAQARPAAAAHPLDLAAAMLAWREEMPNDAIVTLDAGNHTGWPQRFWRFGRPGRQLGSTCGAMGYAVPAAVAAALLHPGRTVIGCVGDGGFMMSGQEIATAVQHGARPVILVFNNGMYGTIRMHQEREHPGRVVGTDLVNPDYVALGQALGAYAERVTQTAQFVPAMRRALACGRAALIEICTDPEQISTRTTLAALRDGRRA